MPSLRVERVPVKTLGLGLLGFDHLQLVYDPSPNALGPVPASQDRWFVIEGLREVDDSGVRLGVEGWYGATTLAEANGGAVGDDLVRRIGTPEIRGSREIAQGSEATTLWAEIVSVATDLDHQRFPYVGYAPEGSALPTVNSSSLVASLLQHAGLDPDAAMPFGLRLSPGLSTLLGTSGDDTLTTGPYGVTTILAGSGADRLRGSDDPASIDKLYGGAGDDAFHWSQGLNIMHGGQPGMDYAADGTDTVSYAGAGHVEITGNRAAAMHASPDFKVTYPGGVDQLFSIEELAWNEANDHVVVGPGVGFFRTSLKLKLGGGDDIVDATRADAALVIDAGPGSDTIEAGSGVMKISGGPGADRYVIAGSAANITVCDATPEDRLSVAWPIISAHADLRPGTNHDLALELTGPASRTAHILVEAFQPGDLGLRALDDASLAAALTASPYETSSLAADHAELVPVEIVHHP